MTLPANAAKTHLDQSTDDPKQARSELAGNVDRFNELLTHMNLSPILSQALGIGTGLGSGSGNLNVDAATTGNAGIAELATDAEVQAGVDTSRIVTPAGLVSLTATEARAGLVELATVAEAVAGVDAVRAVTPAGAAALLGTVMDNDVKWWGTAGTYSYVVPTDVTKILITVIGGGGQGGGVDSHGLGGGSSLGAAGGGQGGTWAVVLMDVTGGESFTITIGAGGSTGAGNFVGRNSLGGTSSFGTAISCPGGLGGENAGGAGPLQGDNAQNSLTLPSVTRGSWLALNYGDEGGRGIWLSSSDSDDAHRGNAGGHGGGTLFAGRAPQPYGLTNSIGWVGNYFGGGGSGAMRAVNASPYGHNGGNGRQGMIMVQEIK